MEVRSFRFHNPVNFLTHGDRFHRSMSRQFFTKDKISHFDNFDRHADLVISKLRDRLREGVAVDVQDLFCRFTIDSASEFLFGSDVQSLSADLPYPSTVKPATSRGAHPSDSFANAFQKAQVASAARSRFGYFWPLVEFWENKVEKEIQAVFDYIDPIVKCALETKKVKELSKVEGEDEDETLLEHLVKLTDGEHPLPPDPQGSTSTPLFTQCKIPSSYVMKPLTSWLLVVTQSVSRSIPEGFSAVEAIFTDCRSHHLHRVYALRASSCS